MNNIKIRVLKAGYGDSLLIEFDNGTTVLVDGGTRVSMQENIGIIKDSYNTHEANYILLTHIDNDHVMGISYMFERHKDICNKVSGVIFNRFVDLKTLTPNATDNPPQMYINDISGSSTSYNQGVAFEKKLNELEIPICSNAISGRIYEVNEIQIIFLSPSTDSLMKYKTWVELQDSANTGTIGCDYGETLEELLETAFIEDNGITNSSSISILIEYKGKKLLFLGDSIPSDIVNSLTKLGYSSQNKLCLDIVKVSHHGSKHNTSIELLEIIQCDKFIISTDGKKYGHPDKKCLAYIIYSQNCPELIFNYSIFEKIFSKSEMDCGKFKICVKSEVEL